MDFSFTEEQTMLRDMVARFVQDEYDFDTFRKVSGQAPGWRPDVWKRFGEELGILGAPFAEEHGGLGGGPIETMVIMEEFGRGLVVEPYIPTVVLGGGALKHGGSAAQQEEHIPAIISGDRVFAMGALEPGARYALGDVQTTAKQDGSGWILNGHKAVVRGAPWADWLVVTARTGGGQRERGGIGVFLVPKNAEGVTTRDYPTNDGARASEVYLENVKLGAEHVLGDPGAGLDLVEQVTDEAIAALCAECAGAMKATHETTLDYAKTRVQFGAPIGKFQVIQHRLVDMFMELEQAVSMTYMATLKLGAPVRERMMAASGAKAKIGAGARFVGQQAVQIHGGIGITEEYKVGHYFKRMTLIDAEWGDVDHHMRRYTALAPGGAGLEAA